MKPASRLTFVHILLARSQDILVYISLHLLSLCINTPRKYILVSLKSKASFEHFFQFHGGAKICRLNTIDACPEISLMGLNLGSYFVFEKLEYRPDVDLPGPRLSRH